MRTMQREDGFTLVELMMATAITLVVLATAMATFKDALALNERATAVSDSNQNLRAGTNMLARDLMQTGRGIPTGGVPIPSGTGATPIKRPSPSSTQLYFDNTTQVTLPGIISGYQQGPMVNGEATDIVTMLAIDPTSYVQYPTNSFKELPLNPTGPPYATGLTASYPTLATDGSSLTVGQFATWLTDAANAVKPGDVLLFTNPNGSAVQTVTRVIGNQVYFDINDPFNFNQRSAEDGTIMQLRDAATSTFPETTVVRLLIITYYVDALTTPGMPRLTRRVNHFPPQALAGVVEDLNITYDLVDGDTNPTGVTSLPHTLPDTTVLSGSQARKVNLHVGVRSEDRSTLTGDYLRHHAATVVSLRGLAYRDTYK